jgi:hypothetical protein
VKQASYQVSYVRAIAGTYKIDVSVNGNSVKGSPFAVVASQVRNLVSSF